MAIGKHLVQAGPFVYAFQCLTGKFDNNDNNNMYVCMVFLFTCYFCFICSRISDHKLAGSHMMTTSLADSE